jgi:hypothetical protein
MGAACGRTQLSVYGKLGGAVELWVVTPCWRSSGQRGRGLANGYGFPWMVSSDTGVMRWCKGAPREMLMVKLRNGDGTGGLLEGRGGHYGGCSQTLIQRAQRGGSASGSLPRWQTGSRG